jgi:hypothetical protein
LDTDDVTKENDEVLTKEKGKNMRTINPRKKIVLEGECSCSPPLHRCKKFLDTISVIPESSLISPKITYPIKVYTFVFLHTLQ